MKIGDEVYVHGYIDEIRKDCIIIRNEYGYFGTSEDEIHIKADRKTELTWEQVKEYCNKRCLDIVDSTTRKQWYKDEPQTKYPRCAVNGTPFDECGFCDCFNCDTCKCEANVLQTERRDN